MSTYKTAQFEKKLSDLQIFEREVPTPGENEVLIKVHACGLCHSDSFVKYGVMTPDSAYPLAPGHEIAGEVIQVGPGSLSAAWKVGDRVAVGWFGGCCFTCIPCREGETLFCEQHPKITGIQRDGGYGSVVLSCASALARIPDGLEYTQAGPLVCAGVTVFNAIRHNAPPPNSLVGVVGVGGLGHLAIQFAVKMGYRTVAISRGNSKKESALALGAHDYIDSQAENVAERLTALGGAKLLVVTATGGHDELAKLLPGLAYHGVMVLCGVDDQQKTIPVSALGLIPGRKSIRGAASGHSRDSEETMEFAHKFGVRVKTQVFPFARVTEAFELMASGKGDLRVVVQHDV